ncbi:GGDEF domain-containing protein [Extensimonas sp. H3M7-6]|uniref:GGDEF domain-containing protein n=1 Tax=Extensimonas soli TaxID=3031322 RepID=UPI0023DB78E4|nr:GGDEF domain-containing protein [Extensimonas sp. H3M7-6]MDF1482296.1 GGDEF domain-containing protein [Extensimonas sp. H3M7-6]
MKPILQNLADMTTHRDHVRLEVSVLSTLQKLSSVNDVRALEIFNDAGVPSLRPRTWLANGKFVSTRSQASTDPRREPLAHYPALNDCIANHCDSAMASLRRGSYTLWLPVWMQDKVATCLEITRSRPFSAHSLDVVKGIFQVYKNYQSLLEYSERDALTGLLNRKTFDEQFSQLNAPQLPGDSGLTPLCSTLPDEDESEPLQQWLALVDIDNFKQINDRFGHLFGDEVLILIANLLRKSFRSEDQIFRFGGEEFVVLLRSATLPTARKVLERFRGAVQDHTFPQVGHITVSIGFVGADKGAPVEVLGLADQALYYAKEHGRNQVHYYDDLVAQGLLQAKVAHDDVELF